MIALHCFKRNLLFNFGNRVISQVKQLRRKVLFNNNFCNMRKLISKKDYYKLKGMNLEKKAKDMKAGIYKNDTIFKGVPLTEDEMASTIVEFADKRTKWEHGGTDQRHAYNIAIEAIFKRMDTLSEYVDKIANGDADIIKMAYLEVS